MADLLVSATVLMAAVLLIRLTLGKRLPPAVRYALWLVVLARLLVPINPFHSPVSVLNAVPRPAAGQTVAPVPPVADVPVLLPDVDVDTPREIPLPETVPVRPGVSLGASVPALYLAGVLAVGLYFLFSNIRFYARLRRTRRPVEVEGAGIPVYRADFLRSPCLAGLWRPAVYFPDGVEEARLGHVLAHELCHKRHGDNWWALLRCVCLCLWWFHPLVWASAVLSRRDCELCCDAAAVRLLGEGERIPYGETLLSLAAGRDHGELLMAATAMTSGKRELAERIRLIAKKPKAAVGILLVAVVLLAGALVCTFSARTEAPVVPGGDVPPEPEQTALSGRKEDYFTFLLLGKSDVGTADTVIAASYDATSGVLSLVSIPRDLYVDSPAFQLSAAVLRSPEDIQRELEKQLGIPFDSYIQVDRSGMAAIIDAMGGVDYDVKRDMDYDDATQNLSIHLEKGPQHLTGEQAVMVAQYRQSNDHSGYADGDLGRTEAQRELLTALAEKAASLESAIELAKTAMEHQISSTIKLQELVWLATDVKKQGENFTVRSALLPVESRMVWNETLQTKLSVLFVEPQAALDVVNEMLNPYVEARTLESFNIPKPEEK